MIAGWAPLLQLTPRHDEGLKIEVSPEWGAQKKDHRHKIRRHLAQSLGVTYSTFAPSRSSEKGKVSPDRHGVPGWVLDLQQFPQTPGFSTSISHCPGLGGYAYSPLPMSVGFDIEEIDRIQLKICKRVSSEAELNGTPQPLNLWPAKEAVYKSLTHEEQSGVALPSITVTSWGTKGSLQVFEARLRGKRLAGKGGVVHLNDRYALALFCRWPSEL